jgi:hypothetical protein
MSILYQASNKLLYHNLIAIVCDGNLLEAVENGQGSIYAFGLIPLEVQTDSFGGSVAVNYL